MKWTWDYRLLLQATCASVQFSEVFPDVQIVPPVFQFVSVTSRPDTGHHLKESGSIPFNHSLCGMHMDKIPHEPPLLQAEQSQFSQPFLRGQGLRLLMRKMMKNATRPSINHQDT